jgi:protein-L-isoaspartate(D-aspartate) O-methyltransferase
MSETGPGSRMVAQQIASRGVKDERLLQAMSDVPRDRFVPEELRSHAYEDAPLPIGEGQTISQPYIVALMIESAELAPGDRVLEIGAGSGYAAAVMGRIADRVYSIERHESLAEAARLRLKALGCDNVEIVTGDGTQGLARQAPFDAIIAAAGGPDVPCTLLDQLAIGGRLVMPVGTDPRMQRLVKLTRRADGGFDRQELGAVRFVPLIGEHGWAADERERDPQPRSIPALIRDAMQPFPEDPDDPMFGAAFDRFANARVVLLGESSHGTSEFYRARAAITRRLVQSHGFSIVAVEADWPDAAAINRWVRGQPEPEGAPPPFQRFPTWMWRNVEVTDFLRWLREHNRPLETPHQVGFYGLDLYNLNASMRAVIDYLDRIDPQAAAVARERYGCLMPWQDEPQVYGRIALSRGYAACETPVAEMLSDLLARQLDYAARDGEALLDATANARLVQNAEAYYRAMYYGAAESWNLRDTHMFETLCQMLDARGEQSRAVVWAHNSHIGDARSTDMGMTRGELNLGQLCRQRFGDEAVLIGFGTHAGTVAAADNWGEPMRVMRMSPSLPESYERLAHDSGVDRGLLDLREGRHPELRQRLLEPRLERFIGVIYRPGTERWSHYATASVPMQFDGYVWFDQTTAVTPLDRPAAAAGAQDESTKEGVSDTFPFGL